MHEFLNEVTGLGIVHSPDLLDTLVIGLFESLETFLQLDELISEDLIFLGQLRVQTLGFCDLHLESLKFITIAHRVLIKSSFETLSLFSKDCLTLTEHLEVENQLLIIESVDGLHVFHALLKDLHLGLKLDLLLGLLVRILTHHILKLLRILRFFLLSLVQVAGLNSLVLLEEVFDLLFVAVKNGTALAVKLPLNLRQLLVVMLAHVIELALHSLDQRINVLRHLLDSLDVVAVLLVDLCLELFDELLLVGDNFSTGCLLSLNVL